MLATTKSLVTGGNDYRIFNPRVYKGEEYMAFKRPMITNQTRNANRRHDKLVIRVDIGQFGDKQEIINLRKLLVDTRSSNGCDIPRNYSENKYCSWRSAQALEQLVWFLWRTSVASRIDTIAS